MKKLAWIILIAFTTTMTFATNIEKAELTVVASSGLKLRTAPNLNSSVVKIIPFGDVVSMVEDSINITDRIEWMEGTWIKINHSGDEGYVFDGFLSSLPLPFYEFEYSRDDLMLLPPVDSWVSYRYDIVGEPQILETKNSVKVITNLGEGHRKIEVETPYMYRLAIQMEDTKLTEAYNLLKNMLNTKYEKNSFSQKSLFIEDKYGDIERIKIGLEEPIEIKKISENKIEINITSFHEGCKL